MNRSLTVRHRLVPCAGSIKVNIETRIPVLPNLFEISRPPTGKHLVTPACLVMDQQRADLKIIMTRSPSRSESGSRQVPVVFQRTWPHENNELVRRVNPAHQSSANRQTYFRRKSWLDQVES